MMRISEHQHFLGWRTMTRSDESHILEQHLRNYCGHCMSRDVFLSEHPCLWNTFVCTRNGTKVETRLNLAIGSSEVEDCAHIECKRGAVYRCGGFVLSVFDGEDFCSVRHTELPGWSVEGAHILERRSDTMPSAILLALLMPREGDADAARVEFSAVFVQPVLRFTADIMFRVAVTAVSVGPFSGNDHEPLPFSEPTECVNSCYTGTLTGAFRHPHVAERYRVYSGACGMEFAFQFPSGNVNVYRGSSRRRVTCKAFPSLSDVVSALNAVCSRTGSAFESDIKMHMLVLDGRCGTKIDVSHEGFFSSYINKVFAGTGFEITNIIQELNVHITVKWQKLDALAAVVFRDAIICADLWSLFSTVTMTITCTRYGTIIYRVSNKKGQHAVRYTLKAEKGILDLVSRMHVMISRFA